MAKNIPLVRQGILENPSGPDIRLDTAEWFAWLEAATTTHFSYALYNRDRGYIDGFLTVRKETRQRGSYYWSVYRRRGHHLYKIYGGRSAALTHDHLERIAARLRDPPTSFQKKRNPITTSVVQPAADRKSYTTLADLTEPFHTTPC
jgi:hypothetical protein